MAKSKKLTKQELREPDEVFQASAAGFQWFQERWMIFVLGFIVLFGGGVGLALFSHFQFQTESEAQAFLAKAANQYQQWALAEGEEKAKAREELDKSLQAIQSDYPSSKAFQLASVYRARLALKDQFWDQAVKEYEIFKSVLPRADQSIAIFALAKTHELREDWSAALVQYDSILQDQESIFRKEALMGKARSLRELNRIDESKAVYESFLREFPSSPEASFARAFMNLSEKLVSADSGASTPQATP